MHSKVASTKAATASDGEQRMGTSRITHWLGEGAIRALANLGGTKPLAWIAAFVLLAILNTVVDQISDAARQRAVGLWLLAPAAILAAFLLLLYWLARKTAQSLEPHAEVEKARPVKVLILFLSPPVDLVQYEKIDGCLTDPDIDSKLGTLGRLQWRMPLAAVAHHLSRLEQLIVLCSPGEQGTLRHFAEFKKLLERLLPPEKSLLIETSGTYLNNPEHKGVDFENPHALISELGQIYRKLNRERVREHDILVDVTGGTKVSTAAGVAITSVLPDRKFQYVSTNTYHVTSFDVTWDIEALAQ